jgi:hypothetical protein
VARIVLNFYRSGLSMKIEIPRIVPRGVIRPLYAATRSGKANRLRNVAML